MTEGQEMQVAWATVGLAGHAALELLNTRAMLTPGAVTDLVADGEHLATWLERVGLVQPDDIATLRKHFDADDLDRAATRIAELRTSLLPAVDAWISGVPLDRNLALEVNDLLRAGGTYQEIESTDTDPTVRERAIWGEWMSVVTPLAMAVADLFANGDADLVHQCAGEHCDLWFYDRTRSHRRRWCSMSTCGNRTKVRAHRVRAAAHPTLPRSDGAGEGKQHRDRL
ncbi:CGNR zinc finger domain-containing protein [Streptomyces graminifolii]|uniref:CGNR zinc finger domain-containing protein n=1 Tax=Streptomyces graminifolii TaxID=1266771 RepID=UPI004057D574